MLSWPPVSILALPIPKTAPLSYEQTFTKVDQVTAIHLKRISELRQEVVVASERAFADAAIKVRISVRKTEQDEGGEPEKGNFKKKVGFFFPFFHPKSKFRSPRISSHLVDT